MTEDKELRIPRHVAIILDGNGRWATKRGMPRKRSIREAFILFMI